MKTFKIAIEETCVQEFEISAKTAEEAISIAKNKYKSGEIILESVECQHKQIAVTSHVSENAVWIEF